MLRLGAIREANAELDECAATGIRQVAILFIKDESVVSDQSLGDGDTQAPGQMVIANTGFPERHIAWPDHDACTCASVPLGGDLNDGLKHSSHFV